MATEEGLIAEGGVNDDGNDDLEQHGEDGGVLEKYSDFVSSVSGNLLIKGGDVDP